MKKWCLKSWIFSRYTFNTVDKVGRYFCNQEWLFFEKFRRNMNFYHTYNFPAKTTNCFYSPLIACKFIFKLVFFSNTQLLTIWEIKCITNTMWYSVVWQVRQYNWKLYGQQSIVALELCKLRFFHLRHRLRLRQKKNSGSGKKTPAPAENFKLVCKFVKIEKFYSLKWKHHLCFLLKLRILRINVNMHNARYCICKMRRISLLEKHTVNSNVSVILKNTYSTFHVDNCKHSVAAFDEIFR